MGSRIGVVAAGVILGVLALSVPASAANPSITILSPQPVIAGRTVVVNGSSFTPSGAVIFFWDGTASTDPPATADNTGNLSGQAVSIPLSLAPGTHTLAACDTVAPPVCSSALASTPVVVGPTVTTTASMPVHRSSSMTITVGGEPATVPPANTPATAIYRWNGGAWSAPIAVPDQATFPITTTVPANAPAHSTFEVCEDAGGGTCVPGTRGTLAVTVVVPVVKPPPTPTPQPAPTPTPALVAPAPAPSPTHSTTPSPARTPSPTLGPTPQATLQPTATPSPSAQPTVGPASAPAVTKPLYTQRSLVHLEVVALVLISTVGVGAMAAGIGGLMLPGAAEAGAAAAGLASGHRGGKGSAASAKVKAIKGGREATEVGDRSITWRFPGYAPLDALALAAPVRVARFSPLLARVLIDASYLRAMLGSLTLTLPLAGVALGILAAQDTHGRVLPPTFALLTAITVLGVFDALAGFVAAAIFMVAGAVSGDLETVHGLRMMLGLGVVWFAAPLIAAATRPLRRQPSRLIADRRRRIADVVLASLIGAWAVQKMIDGLPGLAGRPLPITHDDGRIAVIVLIAIAIRVLLEAIAARWYPMRLGEVQAASVPKTGPLHGTLMALVRTGIFLFFAVAFLGWHWQLWAGAAILLVSQLVSVHEERFPNIPRLHRWLPRGLTKLVLMLFVSAWLGALVLSWLSHDRNAAADAFVLLALAGLVISVVETHGRDGEEREETWWRWLAGVGLLILGLAFVFGYVD